MAAGRSHARSPVGTDDDSSHEVVDLRGDSGSDGGRSPEGARAPARKKRRGGFRLQGKQFAITFPKCPVLRDVFDEVFKGKFRPSEFASAREQHADGSFHLHLFVGYRSRKDVRSARHFDVTVDGVTYHPNIQRVRSRNQWLEYISKGEDHGVADLSGDNGFNPLLEELGKRKSMYADYCWSEQFRVQQQLRSVDYPIKLATTERTYEMYAPDPKIKKRSWWIVAPPNAGKTRWLNRTFAGQRIYSPRTGPYPFEGYLDQDIIVYDDREGVSFAEFASVLNTWDIVQPVAGQVRYNVLNWKLGHTRSVIVLSNKTIEDSMKEEDWLRMKKRFVQIVNPVLLLPEEVSSDEEKDEVYSQPSAASAARHAQLFVL